MCAPRDLATAAVCYYSFMCMCEISHEEWKGDNLVAHIEFKLCFHCRMSLRVPNSVKKWTVMSCKCEIYMISQYFSNFHFNIVSVIQIRSNEVCYYDIALNSLHKRRNILTFLCIMFCLCLPTYAT